MIEFMAKCQDWRVPHDPAHASGHRDTMAIPTYDALMLPVLRLCTKKTWHIRDLIARISDDLGLTQVEREELLPSGGSTRIASNVGWARTYLKKAGLVDQPKRGMVRTTERGRHLLKDNPSSLNAKMLEQFEEFRAFQAKAKSTVVPSPSTGQDSPATELASTPEDQITSASSIIDEALRDDLLARVLEGTPTFFERLIIDLLVKMGYGGARADAGEHLGRTGDGGVDGVIREDQLGLDRVYLQAKLYKPSNVIGPATVQAFMGALIGKGAQKGVLITTSSFTKAAINAAMQTAHLRLVLIDGDELTRLMVRFKVGVRVTRSIEIKRIDLDYFQGEETE
jgi:restriction system protein